ncbi:variant erythrocyte surface antigen-1 alpha subunit [Babesia bovis T2Bo]|uniref:variant erythrocyte surface antigen-1 alpha subunit n=1 Tax=Babesia bovis T2Bo TaxID=484906 RepID=UPI001DA7E467|nr:variant erythrocyte surface antigen-1 alpha subunit [Babesia bovis T2Bo]EDO07153.2 variant erythrocyte surface antigen-1 alpha subunit [Babesia bovis T2Bo]
MAPNSSWKPYTSLTEAPTNLKEAIDWVLRVTGRDGKELNKDTGYQGESDGDDNSKGPQKKRVTECLNGLFSLVQGLGGTLVVRTYIDQLAQVLSALIGWSRIEKCWNGGCSGSSGHGNQHGKDGSCEYLKDVQKNDPCKDCECMKWDDPKPDSNEGHHLGRRCTRCSDDKKKPCKCGGTSGDSCTAETCKCALAGKCCKCYCKGKGCGCSKKECSCVEDNDKGTYKGGHRIYKDIYQSAYGEMLFPSIYIDDYLAMKPVWTDLLERGGSVTPSHRRHQCARIFLGSVCLIWSGITYMYWTGKWAKGSPRWNNNILNGSGLDDGTLSQWLQALGFPRDMLNNHGPKNRWDAVIWDGIRGKLYLGFPDTGNGSPVHGQDNSDNTFRNPAGMNYAGYIHTLEKGAFCSNATIFHKNANGATSIAEENINKCGALYKLYILSCAYFTGLQNKAPPKAENKTPRTIREILYWLSALPYSTAYPKILKHSKGVLKKVAPEKDGTKTLSFLQTGRSAPITVDEFNLFAHFQAVTQYCPLVLIGIQGGLKGADSTKEPAIHSLYANTECHFTYPSVPIQAYNQVVHYIRALFYQLYFLRKQCAMKVALGGKWRECRYGDGVLGKDVVSWMCLGCSPMEHDRKKRVDKVKGEILKGIKESDKLAGGLKTLLEKIGEVVVQLGNAQEALEGKKKDAIEGVKKALEKAKKALESARTGLEAAVKDGLNGQAELTKAKEALEKLTKGGGALDILVKNGNDAGSLQQISNSGQEWEKDYSSAKDRISEAISKVRDALEALKNELKDKNSMLKGGLADWATAKFQQAIDQIKDICNAAKCTPCESHFTKCGQPSNPTVCQTCLQPTTTGVPSPLQAFLEDRLPGFSCREVLYSEDNDKYPPAASHLGHCNGSGQCCPLPMGFRNNFQDGVTHTGARLYGILYFFSNGDMMQSCVYTLVRVTAALSATTPQVLGDVFGFFRGGVGNKEEGKNKKDQNKKCEHDKDPSKKEDDDYICGWCASGLRQEVQNIGWIPQKEGDGGQYRGTVGQALIDIKGDKGDSATLMSTTTPTTTSLSTLTDSNHYVSPLTGELYTAVSATFGGTYLSWVLYLSDALHSGLESLSEAFRNIECRGCKGQCDPNKCKKGEHGQKSDAGSAGLCQCQSIVSCTGVLPVLYRHGFSYGNPFNLEGYQQRDKDKGDYSITERSDKTTKHCHEFLESLEKVLEDKQEDTSQDHPLTNLLSQVGQLQYDIRLPWIFVLTLAWLLAVMYLAFGAIWPLDWTHMRSHWLRGGEHQWQCMWYKVMTGRKGMELVEYFGRKERNIV